MKNIKFDVCWITVNRSCNLRCYFCYALNTLESSKTMLFEDALKIVDFCDEANIEKIIIIGGEPTLYCDVVGLIKYAKGKNIKVSIVTNGVMLSSLEYCKSLIEAGIDEIGVSLKGDDKNSFKYITGKDMFGKVIDGMKNLKSLSYPFSCSMVITESNLFTFLNGVKIAFENGCSGVSLSFAYDFCTAKEKDENYLIKNNPYYFIRAFVSQIDKLNEISNEKWSFESGYPLCVFDDTQIKKFGGHLVTTCQLLNNNGIIFDTELNVLPCNTMHLIKLGKLGVDFNTYEDFCRYADESIYKQVMSYITSLPSEDCKKCSKLENCGGGCVCFWTNTSFDNLKEKKDFLIQRAIDEVPNDSQN